MRIKVGFYGYKRKNGTYNQVVFDPEHKVFCNWDYGYTKGATLVEAKLSKDVDALRSRLIAEGYELVSAEEIIG